MELTVIIGVVAACYLVSRLALRLRIFATSLQGLRLAHLCSAAGVILIDWLLKFSMGGFSSRAAIWILAVQLGWYLIDRKRARLPDAVSG